MASNFKKIISLLFHLGTYRFLAKLIIFYDDINFSEIKKIKMGKNSSIAPTVSIRCGENIIIGENTHVNHLCDLVAGDKAKIIIGDNVLFAPKVYVSSGLHSFKKGELIREQRILEGEIIIGNDVWIGVNAVILMGAVLEDGCIIGANTVVRKNFRVPKNIVAVGCPAKIIKKRV